jgi:hypothetical protein
MKMARDAFPGRIRIAETKLDPEIVLEYRSWAAGLTASIIRALEGQ